MNNINCGNIKRGYKCVQMDQEIERQRTIRISNVCYAIRDYAKEGIDKQVQYQALELLEKVLKKEGAI